MGNVPAKCQFCGHIFFAGIQVASVRNLRLSGNKQRCPRCSGWADIIEGEFNVDASPVPQFTQISGAPVDPDVFSRLGLILVQAKLDKLKPNEIIEKVAPHSSDLARRLSAVADDPQAFAIVIGAIVGAFALIAAAVIESGGSTPNKSDVHIHLQDHTESDLERYRDNFHQLREAGYLMPSWSSDYIEP